MKKVFLLGMLTLVLGSFAIRTVCVAESVPNLVGTWANKVEETSRHSKVTGYKAVYDQVLFIINDQTGRSFSGIKEKYIGDKKVEEEGFSGVIYWDNKTIYIADHDKGLTFATLESPNDIRGAYIEEGKTAKAAIFALKKTK